MTEPQTALTYLARTDAAENAARQHRRQAVRDARTAGALVTEIAATLGIRNRNGLYSILEEKADKAGPIPQPTPVVFIRGAGVGSATWAQITTAMQARGWIVIRDRTQAWHLARARVPVVMIDISSTRPTVGRVRARYTDAHDQALPLADDRVVLDSLDPDQLALAVIEHLDDPKNPAEDMPPAAEASPEAATKPSQTTSDAESSSDDTVGLKKRSIVLPDTVWDRTKAVAYGKRINLHQLIADALNTTMTKIEHQFNGGRSFPSVDRLPTGPRAFHEPRTAGKPRQISLPEQSWARARAIVGAGHALSLPALLNRSLSDPGDQLGP